MLRGSGEVVKTTAFRLLRDRMGFCRVLVRYSIQIVCRVFLQFFCIGVGIARLVLCLLCL